MVLRLVGLLLVLTLGVLAIVWPFRWPAAIGRRAFAAYVGAMLMGFFAILLFPYGHGPNMAFFLVVALATWIMLGAIWTARRLNVPNPDWVKRPWSLLDWGLIVILLLSGIAALLD